MIKDTSKLAPKVIVRSKQARSIDSALIARKLGAAPTHRPPHIARFVRRGGQGGRVR